MANCTQAQTPKDARASGSATTIAVTWGANTTTGNTIVLGILWENTTNPTEISTIVDSQSNSYVVVDKTADTTTSPNIKQATYVAANITGGTTPTITVTFDHTCKFRVVAAHEVGNAATTQPDNHNAKWWSSGPGTGTDGNTANAAITPSQDGCYFFCVTQDTSFNNSVHTAGTGFTRDTNGSSSDVDFSSEHFIQGAKASHIGSWTESQNHRFVTSLVVITSTNGGGVANTSSLTGTLSFVGNYALASSIHKTASLSFSGAVVKAVSTHLTGTLSFVGALKKAVAKVLTGALSFSGALAQSHRFQQLLTATLSFVGAIKKQTSTHLTAGLSFVGAVKKAVSKGLSGGLSFIGAVVKSTHLAKTGALSFVGTLVKQSQLHVTGTVSFVGAVTKAVHTTLSAVLQFSGSLATQGGAVVSSVVEYIVTYRRRRR